MNNWRNFATTDALDKALAQTLASALRDAIVEHGSASLAVSGGSTPKGLFARLSRCELAWQKVAVTLVDERWVEADHADSNERLVRQHLLCNRASQAKFIGLKSAQPEPATAVPEVTARIAALSLPFTAVVLGMGGDGHTASWFPQAANLLTLLNPEGTALVAPCDPVTAPHPRLTLTLAAVLNSAAIALHITGEAKKVVLNSAESQGLPVAAVLRQTVTPVTIWWAP